MSCLGRLPAVIDTPAELWQAACCVAGLRSGFHQGRRAAVRDRGDDQNLLGDVMGAAAELAVLKLAGERQPDLTPAYTAVSFQRTVAEADLQVGQERLEVKVVALGDPRRRWALVNERSGLPKMYEHGVSVMLPVFMAAGAGACVLGRGLSPDRIAAWPLAPAAVAGADPARGMRSGELLALTVGRDQAATERHVLSVGPRIGPGQLIRWARAVRERYPAVAAAAPQLADQSYDALVGQLRASVSRS